MRKLSRDTWVALGLMLLLVIVTVAATIQQTERDAPAFSSTSTQQNGTRAFYLWLEALGYQVSEERLERFAPPADAAAVVILNPTQVITEGDWEVLDPWVEAGGTLIIAGENFNTGQAVTHYDFRLNLLGSSGEAVLATPLWLTPPITESIAAETSSTLSTNRNDYVVHLAIDENPLTVSFTVGEGRVILSTVVYPFTNEALSNEANAHYALNIINMTEREGVIWFDGWHHGLQRVAADDINGPTQFAVRTPAGRALLYVGVVIYVALVLRGQRLGRPLERESTLVRRSPMEYVTAIANLNQKAGHKRAVLAQYHRQIKRKLGRRYRLSPDLIDEAFVEKLEQLNPGLDTHDLLDVLTQLRRENLSQEAMVRIVARATDWIENT